MSSLFMVWMGNKDKNPEASLVRRVGSLLLMVY